MNKWLFSLLTVLFLGCQPLHTQTDTSPLYTEILQILSTQAIFSSSLNQQQIDKAIVNGILQQAGPGIEMTDQSLASISPPSLSLKTALLNSNYLYFHPLTLASAEVLDTIRLNFQTNLISHSLKGILLDLRSLEDYSHYAEAGQLISFFVRKGTTLFSLNNRLSGTQDVIAAEDPLTLTTPLVVLIGFRTAGAGEVIAESLRIHNRAVLVGNETAGRAFLRSETPLSNGKYLQIPTARVLRPGGDPLFPKKILPDIHVPVDPATESAVLAFALTNSITNLLLDGITKTRQSEAALVQGEDPDIEMLKKQFESQKNVMTNTMPILQDAVLKSGLDILKSIDALDLNPITHAVLNDSMQQNSNQNTSKPSSAP